MSLCCLWLQVNNGRFRRLCRLKKFRLIRLLALKRPISPGTAHMQALSLCLLVTWCDTVLFNDKHAAIIYSGVCMWNSKGRRSLIKNKHSVPKLELALVSLHWENWFIIFLPFDIFTFQFPVCRINFTTLTSGIQTTAVPGKWEIGGRTLEQAELTCIYSWINPSEHTWGKICSHPKWDFQEARNKHQWE